jgi:hypothetical protein
MILWWWMLMHLKLLNVVALRDTNRRYLKGFAPVIGSCDALHVKMWGMYIDMDLTWKQKITHLI